MTSNPTDAIDEAFEKWIKTEPILTVNRDYGTAKDGFRAGVLAERERAIAIVEEETRCAGMPSEATAEGMAEQLIVDGQLDRERLFYLFEATGITIRERILAALKGEPE